ncbi:hypothetical protein G6F46_014174 [Rhizopus delemar]|nr:hypothetical protein G6F46_014174 [Rhizopus delemar]
MPSANTRCSRSTVTAVDVAGNSVASTRNSLKTNDQVLVGLLPVAIGTALPEVAAAIAAARRGHGDMVLGHVLGSSAVNLLLVIGAMAMLQPLALPASFVRLELPALLAFALVLYPMLRGALKINRGEGAILLVAFVGWLVLEVLLVGAP